MYTLCFSENYLLIQAHLKIASPLLAMQQKAVNQDCRRKAGGYRGWHTISSQASGTRRNNSAERVCGSHGRGLGADAV
jgi:hypothetical protein